MNTELGWFYLNGEERKGPFDLATIQQLLGAGVIQPETLVAKQGDSDWTPASDALRPLDQAHHLQPTPRHISKKLNNRSWRKFAGVSGIILIVFLYAWIRSGKGVTDPVDSRVVEILIRSIETWQVRTKGNLPMLSRKSNMGYTGGLVVVPLDAPKAMDTTSEIDDQFKSIFQECLSGDLQTVETIFDRWGEKFLVTLDGDGDGRIKIGINGATVGARAAVWSTGKNKINEYGGGDDIVALLNWPPGSPPLNPLIDQIPESITKNIGKVIEFKKPISIPLVAIGNPGNAPDPGSKPGHSGSVGYDYQLATFETTIAQYSAFLNAVASTDKYGLYTTDMITDSRIAGIIRQGQSGSYTYRVVAGSEFKPITYVNWFDAARFVNWLHNGQPDGPQSTKTTEDGAYTMNGAVDGIAPLKNPGAKYWVPTSDEWHKAAYFDPTKGGKGSYWKYPMRCDDLNSNTIGEPNSANFCDGIFVGSGSTVYPTMNALTIVGAYGANSASFYGTNDQGGNVWEWTDGVHQAYDGLCGGSWLEYYAERRMLNSEIYGNDVFPSDQRANVGFRIAAAVGSK